MKGDATLWQIVRIICAIHAGPYSQRRRPGTSAARELTGCPDTHDHFPADMPIAMAYVPWQKWQDIYEPCKGLESGTIFKELDKPFLGKGGMRR